MENNLDKNDDLKKSTGMQDATYFATGHGSVAAPMAVQAQPDLHDAIMNLRCDTEGMDATHALSFKLGHRQARHAAAELAAAADSAPVQAQPVAMTVWERAAQARMDVIDALQAKGMTAEEIAEEFASFGVARIRVILNRDRTKDWNWAAAPQPAVAQADEAELTPGAERSVEYILAAVHGYASDWGLGKEAEAASTLKRIRAMLEDDARRCARAALAARKPAAPSEPTDLSKRLREAATAEVGLAMAKLLIGAADEIESLHSGLFSWRRLAVKVADRAAPAIPAQAGVPEEVIADVIEKLMGECHIDWVQKGPSYEGDDDGSFNSNESERAYLCSLIRAAAPSTPSAQVQPVAVPEDVRGAALEEIAIECERSADSFIGNTEKGSGWREAAYHFANLARDMKSPQQADGKDGGK